ncbi:hypothetical protein CC1G_14666 [Coprinopsis cinerea okayama7|uniref:Uncharacterized protein n=1 Tax=Coprinopsis cinerea (strain Okayama-7 / 130 / ATCC MYA-4618 / FGSC 9003) TaxID=240176 RepID=D6RMS2_COPC7|nr:hypothetical protein CC1G_14666 [Coprinopsis cinerea okayama7\|eukprot:XP_002911237.1 hypothetical protein CC1G_14666 [Coprinopsis cinerea okayama7\
MNRQQPTGNNPNPGGSFIPPPKQDMEYLCAGKPFGSIRGPMKPSPFRDSIPNWQPYTYYERKYLIVGSHTSTQTDAPFVNQPTIDTHRNPGLA